MKKTMTFAYYRHEVLMDNPGYKETCNQINGFAAEKWCKDSIKCKRCNVGMLDLMKCKNEASKDLKCNICNKLVQVKHKEIKSKDFVRSFNNYRHKSPKLTILGSAYKKTIDNLHKNIDWIVVFTNKIDVIGYVYIPFEIIKHENIVASKKLGDHCKRKGYIGCKLTIYRSDLKLHCQFIPYYESNRTKDDDMELELYRYTAYRNEMSNLIKMEEDISKEIIMLNKSLSSISNGKVNIEEEMKVLSRLNEKVKRDSIEIARRKEKMVQRFWDLC